MRVRLETRTCADEVLFSQIWGTIGGMPTTSAEAAADRQFENLYREHRREVYRLVLRDIGNPDEAEDVTQIAFLDAYRALRRGNEPQSPRAWLLAIAQNAARRRFRARAQRGREVGLQPELLVAPEEEGPSAREIQDALGRLSRRQREALVLREIAGRPYSEIAAALGATVPAVETLLFRARRAFREELAAGEAPAPARRGLGGLLAWPLLDGRWDGIASAAASLARRGASVKLAGAASAAALGTGLAVQAGAPARGEPASDPAPITDATAAAPTVLFAPLARLTADRPAARPPASKARDRSRRPATERSVQRQGGDAPPNAAGDVTGPVVGLVESVVADGTEAVTAPVRNVVREVVPAAPELPAPELPKVEVQTPTLPKLPKVDVELDLDGALPDS